MDFLFDSDYPVDKVVLLKEDTIPLNGDPHFTYQFYHGLKTTPFCWCAMSADNWKTVFQDGTQLGGAILGILVISYFLQLSANINDLYIDGYFKPPDGPVPDNIQIRIWGVIPEGSTFNLPAPETSKLSKTTFWFNSDYKYPGVVKEGIADASNADVVIKHGLGYIPMVEFWYKRDNNWYIMNSTNISKVMVTDSTVTFKQGSYSNIYYRIYAYDLSI